MLLTAIVCSDSVFEQMLEVRGKLFFRLERNLRETNSAPRTSSAVLQPTANMKLLDFLSRFILIRMSAT